MLKFAFLQCRFALARVLVGIEFTSEDDRVWNELTTLAKAQGDSPVSIALEQNRALSPGVWATIITAQLYSWEEGGRNGAEWLFPMMEQLSPTGTEVETLTRRVCPVVSLIGEAESRLAARDDEGLPSEVRWDLVEALSAAAECCLQKFPGVAYDLSALASVLFDILEPPSDPRADALRPRLSAIFGAAARLGGKPNQIAAAAMFEAFNALVAADTDPGGRLGAYDLCELAVERMHALPGGNLRSGLTETLARLLQPRSWARALVLFLAPDLSTHSRHKDMVDLIGVTKWLPRVSHAEMKEWVAQASHPDPA
jgi:hypothetical protein